MWLHKKICRKRIWNKLNKNDPGHVSISRNDILPDELVANESSGIKTIVHEKLKYYFIHKYSELAEKFSNLNWKKNKMHSISRPQRDQSG